MTKTKNNMNLKKVFGSIQTLLIVVLIIIILLMRNCSGNSNPKPKPREIVKTTIEYIPVDKEIPVYIPKWKEKIITDIDTFLVNVDTNAILSDYYAKYYFVDILFLDTLGYVLVEDTVTQNKITSRKVNYKVNIPKITIEKTIYVNEREFYYGLGLAGNPKQLNYLGAEMLYRTKKKQAYGLGVGVNQNFQPVITGRIFWKIGK